MAIVKTPLSYFSNIILFSAIEGFYSYVLRAPLELNGHIFIEVFVSYSSVMNVRSHSTQDNCSYWKDLKSNWITFYSLSKTATHALENRWDNSIQIAVPVPTKDQMCRRKDSKQMKGAKKKHWYQFLNIYIFFFFPPSFKGKRTHSPQSNYRLRVWIKTLDIWQLKNQCMKLVSGNLYSASGPCTELLRDLGCVTSPLAFLLLFWQ